MSASSDPTLQWNEESHIPSVYTRRKIIAIEDSLWYSSAHESYDSDVENGMTEYSMKSHKVIQTIPYPADMTPTRHCCCAVGDIIYIIDGQDSSITAFDPKSKTYTRKISIDKIGDYPNAEAISDKIRIFNGGGYNEYDHRDIIYDTTKNTLITYQTDYNIYAASTVLYQNKLVSIGGFNWNDGAKKTPEVRISQELNNDEAVKWEIKSAWELPKGLYHTGCVIYRNYILLFGGESNSHGHQDAIYILDLDKDDGWQRLEHINCPVASLYVATLTPDNHVHLFLGNNGDKIKGHYELPLLKIMGDLYQSKFDLSALKYVDSRTRNIVYGYFRNEYDGVLQFIPNEIIDICLVYFFV